MLSNGGVFHGIVFVVLHSYMILHFSQGHTRSTANHQHSIVLFALLIALISLGVFQETWTEQSQMI